MFQPLLFGQKGTQITPCRVGGNLTYVPAVTVWVEGYGVPVATVVVEVWR